MLLEGTVIEESHEDDEENLASLTWQQIAENRKNFITFENAIEEFHAVVPENEEDKLPEQLSDVANNILFISLGIKVNSFLLTYSYNQTIFHSSRLRVTKKNSSGSYTKQHLWSSSFGNYMSKRELAVQCGHHSTIEKLRTDLTSMCLFYH
jgi:hypothetical protein